MRNILALLLPAVVGAWPLWGQCNPGDIIWVSETVDANVGTATGGGGTSGRCATNTVAGAAYNNPASPFGIQGAFDCSCPGATIRILAGANNYDSTTNSWTNRINAAKEVQLNIVDQVRVEGWVDSSTECNSMQQAGCPITLDFAGGTGDGITRISSGSSQNTNLVKGLRVINAAQRCFELPNISRSVFELLEGGNCGDSGLLISGTGAHGIALLDYMHDTGLNGFELPANNTDAFMTEMHDNVNGASPGGGVFIRSLNYDNDTGINYSGAEHTQFMFNTVVRSTAATPTGSGLFGGTGNKDLTGVYGFLSQQNTGLGMTQYVATGSQTTGTAGWMTTFFCAYLAGNAAGAISNPMSPAYAQIRDTPNTTDVASFASSTNFSVSGVDTCAFSWLGSTTTMNSCPGGVPDCVGGGLFIQSVR